MKKRLFILIITLTMVLNIAPGAFAAATPFDDVPASSWYTGSVDYVYQHQLMVGTSDRTFSPQHAVDRAMAVTILYRLNGSSSITGTYPFQDVAPDQYYHDAVLWAVQNGITYGISGSTFAPNQSLSREQLVAFLFRYAECIEANLSYSIDTLNGFTDRDCISNYALIPFAWAVQHGFIYGTSETQLSPRDGATRAECAAIFTRFHKWIYDVGEDELTPSEPDFTELPSTEPTHEHTYDTAQKCYTNEENTEFECHFICSTCGNHYISQNEYAPPPEFKRAVAAACAYYINQFRIEDGSIICEVLPGMTQVAAYRAVQLQTNFAHDEDDIREAHAQYEYGEFIDMTRFGYDESYSYWSSNAMEAITISGTGPNCSADEIGMGIAINFRNSPSHWSYIGSNSFSFLAVGVEYGIASCWSCCVMINNINYG